MQAIEISALRRTNLVALLEAIVAQAEVMQLSADPTGPAEALVLECRTEHGLGCVPNSSPVFFVLTEIYDKLVVDSLQLVLLTRLLFLLCKLICHM